MVYRFDQFEVDDREFRLSEDGTPVQMEPKVLRLLVYLIENRNRLVRKQELLDKVWPDAMVTENALTRAVAHLRNALNEDSRVPRYIETVPTAGYRFIANVSVVSEADPSREPGGIADETPNQTPRQAPRQACPHPSRRSIAVASACGNWRLARLRCFCSRRQSGSPCICTMSLPHPQWSSSRSPFRTS